MRVDRKVQPGRFLLPRGADNVQILRYLLRSSAPTKDVTIVEGLTTRQIAGVLSRELGVDSAAFVKMCEDSQSAARFGVPAERLEGYLFPDTYNFYLEPSAEEIVERMTRRFFAVFYDTLRAQLEAVGLTMHQAVTLASIIQGEVMDWSEAAKVSAVYHNRLRRGMPLEADPTIQFIIPDGPRRLLNDDLRIKSLYNTYLHRGLPPGPINNPGRRALVAALYPADVDYIYMVARGDGTHAFNNTFAGHRRDKRRLQRIRRMNRIWSRTSP